MKKIAVLSLLLGAFTVAKSEGHEEAHGFGKLDIPSIFFGNSMFVQNMGQLEGTAQFSTSAGQAHLFYSPGGLQYQYLTTEEVYVGGEEQFIPTLETWSLQFEGANAAPRMEGETQADFFLNVYGNGLELDSIPAYQSLWYRELYPGTDLHYYYAQGHLEYDFVLQPGADLSAIRMRMEGIRNVRVQRDGKLLVKSPAGAYWESAPVAWQDGPQGRTAVEVRFRVRPGNVVTLVAPQGYDPALPLVVDPVTLDWFTFLGGNAGALEGGYNFDVSVDGSNNLYATGWYKKSEISGRSPSLLGTTGASGLRETYVCKLTSAGAISYLTLVQGNHLNFGLGIHAEAGTGITHIVGATRATNLPTMAAFQGAHGGGTYDGYYMRLNATGARLCLSYLGGAGEDNQVYGFTGRPDTRADFSLGSLKTGITWDGSSAYLCGWTTSASLPGVANARSGATDGFVAKITPGGTYTCSSRFLGGAGGDTWAYDVAVTGTSLYVGGTTNTTAFYNGTTTPGGDLSGFVTRLTTTSLATAPSATRLLGVHASATGGTSEDCYVESLALDASGNVYCSGVTERRLGLPAATAGAYFYATSSSLVNFFYKMPANLSSLDLRYMVPAYDSDDGSDLWVAPDGSHILGVVAGDNFNLTASSAGDYTKAYSSGADVYWVIINTATHTLRYGQFMGGNSSDYACAMAAVQSGSDYTVWLGFTTHSTAATPTSLRARPTSGVDEPAFAKFTVTGLTLPVTLLQFQGKREEHGNHLYWIVAKEAPGTEYTLEAGTTPDQLQDLASLVSPANATGFQSYDFADPTPGNPHRYYRLRISEPDGSHAFSEILHLEAAAPAALLAEVFPSPQYAGMPLHAHFTQDALGADLALLDMTGRLVHEAKVDGLSLLISTEGLAAGTYLLRVSRNGVVEAEQVLLR